jgi:hypothetical protein
MHKNFAKASLSKEKKLPLFVLELGFSLSSQATMWT